MDERNDRCTDVGTIDGRTYRRTDGWTDGRTDGWTGGQLDGWTDGPMDGRTNGRTIRAKTCKANIRIKIVSMNVISTKANSANVLGTKASSLFIYRMPIYLHVGQCAHTRTHTHTFIYIYMKV